jgi:Lsr2
LGVSLVRITIDTREDSYEDAIGVLRRAYGRHRVTRKTEESLGAVDSSEGGAVAKESGMRTAPVGRKDSSLRRGPARGGRRPAAKRTSAASTAAVESPVSTSPGKSAAGREAARGAPAGGRPGAPRKRATAGVAANTAPRGESEAVRAWAQDQGMQVRARGRMPSKVIAAYLEAHPN